VILARDFPAGTGVSYGRAFITERPMRIATLGVGYADGYQRQVTGKDAYVLIRGQRCAVLGRVTMDQIMVDISAVPAIEPGEEVVLIGRQGSEEITASTFAQWAGTIPWHVFTSLGTRVVRVEANESAAFQNGKPR
jgi:alanine racemase